METAQLAALLQLSSPALPIGGYSYSQGLEAAVEMRIVADEASFLRSNAGVRKQLIEGGALVMHALEQVANAQIRSAPCHQRRLARADDRGCYAGLLQQLDTVSIQHVERLDHFAVGTIVQAAVGQNAVDIENHQADARGAGSGKIFHQITLARVRSWICSAPTSLPSLSATSN